MSNSKAGGWRLD